MPENQTPAYKAAKLAVIILSGWLSWRWWRWWWAAITHPWAGKAPAGAPATATFQLPAGARIVDMQSQPGRLILHVRRRQAGEEIDLLDTQDGHLVGQVRTTSPHDLPAMMRVDAARSAAPDKSWRKRAPQPRPNAAA